MTLDPHLSPGLFRPRAIWSLKFQGYLDSNSIQVFIPFKLITM